MYVYFLHDLIYAHIQSLYQKRHISNFLSNFILYIMQNGKVCFIHNITGVKSNKIDCKIDICNRMIFWSDEILVHVEW